MTKFELTTEQTAAVVAMASLHQQCVADADWAAAAADFIQLHPAGSRVTFDADSYSGTALRNVLIDVMKAGLVDDDSRPAFRACLKLADELDQQALDRPVGTA